LIYKPERMVGRRASLLIAFAAIAMPARADAPDPVVIQVGAAQMTASEVARRLAEVPTFQRRALGKTDDEIRHRFAEDVLVPELLFSQYADQKQLASVPHVRLSLREALSRALGNVFLDDPANTQIADAELRTYYDSHRDDYEKPERIRISRILVDDEALAKRILTDASGIKGAELWKQLARDHSLDAATKLRGGNLGFVYPDGRTDVPQVAVDPALYAAAAKVKDGELVQTPVKEAGHLAVVWRRGTLPAVQSSFAAEREAIHDILAREKAERAFTALREELRQREVKDENPVLLESLKDSAGEAPSSSSGVAPPPFSSADPTPHETDRGLR
jgi:peptidyl-prolyl cis-trans isomerase C